MTPLHTLGAPTDQEHVNRDLLALVLEVVDVCPRNALRCIGKHAYQSHELRNQYWGENNRPASVRFPLLV